MRSGFYWPLCAARDTALRISVPICEALRTFHHAGGVHPPSVGAWNGMYMCMAFPRVLGGAVGSSPTAIGTRCSSIIPPFALYALATITFFGDPTYTKRNDSQNKPRRRRCWWMPNNVAWSNRR